MFLIDDLLFAPLNGLLWVVEQVRDAAEEERAGEADAITEQLRQLYLQLEQGAITEDDFDAEEQRLLDRLDVLRAEDDEDVAEDDGLDPAAGAAADEPA